MRGKTKEVIAILLADIHLSLKAPVWRSAEPDWLRAQLRPLDEVKGLQLRYKCPVLCAGDIFDRNRGIADGWNAPPELINYAMSHLPNNMYCIPGQHDLPNHRYEDIKRSAYWTLVEAGKITNLSPETDGVSYGKGMMRIFAFPHGCPIRPCSVPRMAGRLYIAVVHDYVWIPGSSYSGAPKEKKIRSTKLRNGRLMGYDVIVYGDNHKGFKAKIGKTTIFNCGTLMRRKSDEIDYKPQVGLLLKSGMVIPHYLDISKDKYLLTADPKGERPELDLKSFMEKLEKLGKTELDFEDAMEEFIRAGKVCIEAGQIILEAMEKDNGKKD